MLTADTDLQIGLVERPRSTPSLPEHLHPSDRGSGMDPLPGFLIQVVLEELASIVTAETKGHLGKVVRAKGEELCFLGNCIGHNTSPGDLDHGADQVVELDTLLSHGLFAAFTDVLFKSRSSSSVPTRGIMTSGRTSIPSFVSSAAASKWPEPA